MEESTRKFKVFDHSTEIRETLSAVYNALIVKGYNPINQIVGYILSEDQLTLRITTMPAASSAVGPGRYPAGACLQLSAKIAAHIKSAPKNRRGFFLDKTPEIRGYNFPIAV
jgi:hypothetical protein